MSRKPVFGYRLMALSLMAILVLGFPSGRTTCSWPGWRRGCACR